MKKTIGLETAILYLLVYFVVVGLERVFFFFFIQMCEALRRAVVNVMRLAPIFYSRLPSVQRKMNRY